MSAMRLHCNLSHIDMAITHCQKPQIFLTRLLAGRRKFRDGPQRRGLRLLPARVRINFGIQNQQFDVMA
jgi:hypothetical protein